jgi:predicted transposase YdaD
MLHVSPAGEGKREGKGRGKGREEGRKGKRKGKGKTINRKNRFNPRSPKIPAKSRGNRIKQHPTIG